jgi:lipopolysaccharide export system protein LptA
VINRTIKIFILQTMLLFSGVLFVYGQKVRDIDYTSDILQGIKINGEDVRKLVGNAAFRDSSTTMYCDSAYFYKNEDIDAFGNIRIFPNRSNTQLTGKSLHYNKAERTASISRDVILVDNNSILKTDIIYYNVATGIANYPNKGTITKENSIIVSNKGAFNSNINTFYLKEKVVVTNPSYIIHTDTMNYITTTKEVEFLGPTIITSKEDSIYCESGWYDTKTDISEFRKNAWLKGSGKIIHGDTLYYEKKTGYGRGYGHVEVWDTTQDVLIRGNYATIDRPKQIAVVTKKALMIWVDKNDSLYLHADTIRTGIFTEYKDSLTLDTFKFVKAYHHVKFFKPNFQGLCDSMFYSLKDSTLQLIGKPVLWSEGYQLTADYAKLFTKNQKMEHLEMNGLSFIINLVDSGHFDQIKGKNMVGYFVKNEIVKMIVKGNGQSIYFPLDKGGIQGVNKTESSSIILYFRERKFNKITYINSVSGTLTPLDQYPKEEMQLKDFQWHIEKRPGKWQDVFIW